MLTELNVITWWMPQIWQIYPLLVPWCIRTFPGQQSISLSPWIWLFVVQKHWPRGCHIESNIREIFFIYIRCLSTDFTVCTTSWGGTKETIKTESKIKKESKLYMTKFHITISLKILFASNSIKYSCWRITKTNFIISFIKVYIKITL